MIIYLAGPFFSLAERTFNEEFARSLERNLFPSHVVMPQNVATGPAHCFAGEAILQCNAIVAILDGADADPGTCVALGYARGKGKTIVGIRTDFRQSEDRGLNLMVSNICSHLIVKPCTSVTIDKLAIEVASLLSSASQLADVPAAGEFA